MPPIGLIERLAAGLTAVATLIAFFFASPGVALGIGVGGVLGVANFYALKSLMRGIARAATSRSNRAEDPASGSQPRQAVLSILLMIKFALMGAVLFVLLNFTTIDSLGLLIGISMVVVAVFVEGFRLALRNNAAPQE